MEIFYPYYYAALNRSFDLIIIEGWFPLIHDFISMARTYGNPIILYYCLDPVFPGMDTVYTFDVDGYLTNSKSLANTLSSATGAPTAFVMLAADPEIMRPSSNSSKRYGAVYVGAGGDMLHYKPHLQSMLSEAIPYNLLLHGSHWEGTVFHAIAKGPLKHNHSSDVSGFSHSISMVYGQAHVILAATITSQLQLGMINNRLFEAAAVGVVISDYSPAIYDVFGDAILYASQSTSVAQHIAIVMSNVTYANTLAAQSRRLIETKHTYNHRVVEILHFYHEIAASLRSSVLPERHAQPKAALIVDSHLVDHGDYQFVISQLIKSQTLHTPTTYSTLPTSDDNALVWDADLQRLYDVLIIIATPSTFPEISPTPLLLSRNIYQKRLCYIFPSVTGVIADVRRANPCDIVMHRDNQDYVTLLPALSLIPAFRVQHVFGINGSGASPTRKNSSTNVVVCFALYIDICGSSNRKNFIANSDVSTMILLGQSFDFWSSASTEVVEPDMLHKILHISSFSSLAVNAIATATKVYLMYGSESSSSIEVWPFVVAAVHNASITVATANSKILSLASGGISDWNEQYGIATAALAMRRLHSFPIVDATLRVDASIANASTISISSILYFVPEFSYYSAGRDGETCLYHYNTSLLCIVRDFSYFRVVFNTSNTDYNSNEVPLEISIRMKGSFYADDVATTSFVYSLCVADCTMVPVISEKPPLANEITVVIDV